MSEKEDLLSPNARRFRVHCDAGSAGHFRVATKALSVHIGQAMRTEGPEELEVWDSVLVSCAETADGSLEIEVTVFHPDWDEGRQIVRITSRPDAKRINGSVLNADLGPTDKNVA